jgi:hypothetical protein
MATYTSLKEWAVAEMGSPLAATKPLELLNSEKKGNQNEIVHWFNVRTENGKQETILISQSLVKLAKGANGLCTKAKLRDVLKAKKAVIEDWTYEDAGQTFNGWWYRLPGGHTICAYNVDDIDF